MKVHKYFALLKVADAHRAVSDCLAEHINSLIDGANSLSLPIVQAGLSEIEHKVDEMFRELETKIKNL